jgi:DNA polymerase I - 3''-5'' exonuclease and polymerase domains
VAPQEVTHEMRRRAKAVNFGIVYGISPFSLSQDIGVSQREAKEYMESYFATFPGVRRYMDGAVEQAKQRGYAETIFHRRRDLPELTSSNHNLRSFGERVALNMPIQGAAADVMKLAMDRDPLLFYAGGSRLEAHRVHIRRMIFLHQAADDLLFRQIFRKESTKKTMSRGETKRKRRKFERRGHYVETVPVERQGQKEVSRIGKK